MRELFRARREPEDAPFDADRGRDELQAERRNRRPLYLIGALLVGTATLMWAQPAILSWVGWQSDEREERRPEIKPAWDAAALAAYPHPDPEPLAPVPPTPPPVVTPRPPTIGAAMSPPPRATPPRAGTQIEPITSFNWSMSWVPQTAQRPPTVQAGQVPAGAWGCTIRPGQNVIIATFNDDVRWDYGGPIIATVAETVYSAEGVAAGERIPLIPQGAQLFGYADSNVLKNGMDMASGLIFQTVTFTDRSGMPRMISLFDATAANAAGVNAIGGQVDPRWWPIIGAATAFTLLDVIGSIQLNLGDSESVNVRVGGSAAAQIGREVIASMLPVKPRIYTPKGTAIVLKPKVPIEVCPTF